MPKNLRVARMLYKAAYLGINIWLNSQIKNHWYQPFLVFRPFSLVSRIFLLFDFVNTHYSFLEAETEGIKIQISI